MTPLEIFAQYKLVPIVVIDDADDAPALADALVNGGLPIAEVTLRTEAALEAIRRISGREDILVGAGTVLRREDVDAAFDAGAKFIVSPGFSPAVVSRCAELGLAVLPGVASATDIHMAVDQGLDTVKFFPAGINGGVKAIKALAGPFGQMKFVPSGGVNLENVREYLDLACVPAAGGSWMVPRSAVAEGDFARVTQLCAEAVRKVQA